MEKFLIIFDVRKKGISYFFFETINEEGGKFKTGKRQRVRLNAGGLLEIKGSKCSILFTIS